MITKTLTQKKLNVFTQDTFDWFSGNRHGHIGKWGYSDPYFPDDPVRGAILWDLWEQVSGHNNMLQRQGRIIQSQIKDILSLAEEADVLIDLGCGSLNALKKNTLPFVHGLMPNLKEFYAVDISKESCADARKYVQASYTTLKSHSVHGDMYHPHIPNLESKKVIALMMGGTIGNFEAPQNVSNSISLMAQQLRKLKVSLPQRSFLFIGLEAVQNEEDLYKAYDNPVHAKFEVNIMHGIQRDVLGYQSSFKPYEWKYTMKWWPDAYQFCHIAEATSHQSCVIDDQRFDFPKGTQLVADNSFKFPVPAMQLAAQLAGMDYLRAFSDDDGRMIIHALQL